MSYELSVYVEPTPSPPRTRSLRAKHRLTVLYVKDLDLVNYTATFSIDAQLTISSSTVDLSGYDAINMSWTLSHGVPLGINSTGDFSAPKISSSQTGFIFLVHD